MAGKKITFTFNGKSQTKTTNSNGRAYFNLSVNEAGSYPLSIKFAGDTYYNALSEVKTITVVGYDVTFVAPNKKFKVDEISEGYTYGMTLRDSDGNALAGKKITFTFNGKSQTKTTNANGRAYFNLSVNEAGSYSLSIKFAGDTYYNALSEVRNIAVVKRNVALNTQQNTFNLDDISGGAKYTVLLRDSEGNPLANEKITFNFNGKNYVGRTDSKGYCYFDLTCDEVGNYSATIMFEGNNYYNSKSLSKTIKLLGYGTKISWKSETTFTDSSQTLKVLLTDSKNAALSGKTVKLTINSNTYSEKTDSNGYATFNLNLGPNSYTVSYKFEGDNKYKKSSGSAKITVIRKNYEGNGYFVFGGDMKNVNLNTLASYGTTDLFLNYYAIQLHGKSAVESWIASANKLGINVHIWMQVYYDGSWINPISNGAYNTKFSDERIAEAVSYAKIKGVSGVLFDYLRYPGTAYKTAGGTDAITKFARLATDAIHKVNPNILVSAALMPETTSSIYYYGQDYSALSGILDAVLPMVYKGNYKSDASWIYSTTKWYVDNSKGAVVWSTLQSYKSDDDVTVLPTSELSNDAKMVLKANASGIIIFRYGVSNLINFTDLDYDDADSTSVSISDILSSAETVKSYYASNKKLPTTVTVAGNSYTMPEFLYLMSQAIYQLGNSNTNPISSIDGVKSASSPSGDDINAQLNRTNYVTVAKNVANYIKSNNQAPNYASSAVGKISYTVLGDAFSRILAFYKNNDKYLPNYVTIVQSESEGSSDGPDSVSIDNILTGAVNLKSYYENNGVLPNTITVAGHAFTAAEFLYLMDQAIYQLGNSNTTDINCIYSVNSASSPSGDDISAQLNRTNYVTVAKNVANYIKSNNQAPNYASSAVGKISYTTLIDASSRILAFYKNNNVLPNYVTINQDDSSSDIVPSRVNVINTITDLTPYYQSTKNCQVNNSQIKELVNSLTSGLTTDQQKAVAIYNYVRDQISYSFYYDTKYGAVGTLNAKTGNCVDQAHLLVAMYRTAGLAARYEHGTCYFPLSGSTYGHVWTQVLIGNMWIVGDPTSNRNSFGVVNNWNTNTYTHNGYYASLPF